MRNSLFLNNRFDADTNDSVFFRRQHFSFRIDFYIAINRGDGRGHSFLTIFSFIVYDSITRFKVFVVDDFCFVGNGFIDNFFVRSCKCFSTYTNDVLRRIYSYLFTDLSRFTDRFTVSNILLVARGLGSGHAFLIYDRFTFG